MQILKIAKRLLIGLGMVTSATVLLTLAAPKPVHALVAALVQVANTVSNPVATTESLGTDEILTDTCQINQRGGLAGVCYTVPAGKRAIIEHLDGTCETEPTYHVFSLGLQGGPNGTFGDFIPLQLQDTPNDTKVYSFNLPVRYYVSAGNNIAVYASTDDPNDATCFIGITGRLLPTS